MVRFPGHVATRKDFCSRRRGGYVCNYRLTCARLLDLKEAKRQFLNLFQESFSFSTHALPINLFSWLTCFYWRFSGFWGASVRPFLYVSDAVVSGACKTSREKLSPQGMQLIPAGLAAQNLCFVAMWSRLPIWLQVMLTTLATPSTRAAHQDA